MLRNVCDFQSGLHPPTPTPPQQKLDFQKYCCDNPKPLSLLATSAPIIFSGIILFQGVSYKNTEFV